MALCHECDSQVAEIDVFCPYCGISLQPIALDDDVSDIAMEQTVFMATPPKPTFDSKVSLTKKTSDDIRATAPEILPEDPAEAPTVMQSEYPSSDELRASAERFEIENSASSLESKPGGLNEPPTPEILKGNYDNEDAPQNLIFGDEVSAEARYAGNKNDNISAIVNDTAPGATLQEDLDALVKAHTGGIEPLHDSFVEGANYNAPASAADKTETGTDPFASVDYAANPIESFSNTDEPEIVVPSLEREEPVVETPPSDLNPWMPGNTKDIYASVPQINISDDVGGVEPSSGPDFKPLLDSESQNSDDQYLHRDKEASNAILPEQSSAPASIAENLTEGNSNVEPAKQSFFSDNDLSEIGFDSKPDGFIPTPAPLARSVSDIPSPTSRVKDESAYSSPPHLPKVITDDIAPDLSAARSASAGVTISGTSANIGTGENGVKKTGLKPLAEGTILNNRYEIVRKIGGGGMGAVYLALDKNLGGVHRAVKEMVQSHIEEDQQQKAVDDFKRESMILSALDHPSIPTIYDYFYDEAESRFYLVMKYISGGDLTSRLRSAPGGRIEERTVTEWALQITEVLSYLHGLPTTIVYRDLKPSNVMLDGNSGRIMLIDFGIARSINQKQEKGVTAVGTMGYAPPELFSGNVEPRSDIYSLGSTMFHLLTGADPQSNPLLIFDFQKNPRPRQINPQLSDQMERILMRAVEYNADARFSTADEMRHVLSDHLENLRRGSVTFGVTEVPDSVSLANQSVFCGFCGQRIVATDLFCAFCGAKQPIAQQGVHSEIYARASGTAKLIIDGTSELDAPVFSLEKNENLVGRRDPMSNIFPEVDLSKYDPQTKISRRHARIWADGGKFMVEDLGSSNGTVLLPGMSDSFRLLPHTPHTLANGDRIRVGDTTLHFLVG